MADLLADGLAWLEGKRHEHMTRTVVYQRGAEQIDWQATVGKSEFEFVDRSGTVERVETRDFLGRAVDLVLGGASSLPEPGDQIRETSGEQVLIYEVLALPSEPAYRFSDPNRTTVRIHTKHVATEPA